MFRQTFSWLMYYNYVILIRKEVRMMHQKQNKRRKRSKKFFKALHIIVITLKYAFKILKELKAIIELFNKKQKIRYAVNIPDFFGNL